MTNTKKSVYHTPEYMVNDKTEHKNGKIIYHNKFYFMRDNGDGTLTSWFGKIDLNSPTKGRKELHPITEWNEIISKRKEHGYEKRFYGFIEDLKIVEQLTKVHIVEEEFKKLKKPVPVKISELIDSLRYGTLLSANDMIFLNNTYKDIKEK